MESPATREMVDNVCSEIEKMGLQPQVIEGSARIVIGITGNKSRVNSDRILAQPGVKDIVHVTQPYRLVSREAKAEDTIVKAGGVEIGGPEFVVMAGPCAVESREQCMAIAEKVVASGAKVFRGGAYKPRTSPYSFQGLKEDGLKILAEVRDEFGLAVVTEAIDIDVIDMVADYADIVQIGSRNMQNYSLLRKAGHVKKPILLKRGMAATMEEFLMAAEYIMNEGNPDIILCERGVRTFADHTRNTLDLSAVPYIKHTSHLPIITDPSHGTGRKDKVTALSRASIAAGADGLLVEVHHKPAEAMSDGSQSITPESFDEMMRQMRRLADALDRSLP